jgi:hypothetical protein
MIASGLARTQHGWRQAWMCGKVRPDTEEVTGSNPVSSTSMTPCQATVTGVVLDSDT